MSDIRFNRWLHQSGTGGVYQDSAGNIGIGTSVPTSALDIQSGTVKIGSNTLSSSGVSTFTTVNATSLSGNLNGNVIATGVSTMRTILPESNNSYDLGSSSVRWANIYSNDLQLSNEGSVNDIDGTWGNYTIQEGENDLFLINRRNGKKYKFVLEEVN
jgi:hypothetical protein